MSEVDSDMTLGEDEPSIRDMLRGLTTMMATMNTRMDGTKGEGRKKRRVAFRNHPVAGRTSEDEAAPETAGDHPVAHGRPRVELSLRPRVRPPPPRPTLTRRHLIARRTTRP